MLANPRGWKKKQTNARRKTSPERLKVRAIRAEHARIVREQEEAERKAAEVREDSVGPTTLADVTPKLERTEEAQGSPTPPQPIKARTTEVFDLSGPWFETRTKVKDTLGFDKAPRSKAEARAALTEAGYTVEG